MEDCVSFFLAGERSFRRVQDEYKLKSTPLRVLLSLRSMHIKQYSYVSVRMLIDCGACRNAVDIYKGLAVLVSSGLAERKNLQRGVKVGDVYSLTGKGINIAMRFNTLSHVEQGL